jgi:hypothetical protein
MAIFCGKYDCYTENKWPWPPVPPPPPDPEDPIIWYK